MAIRTAVNQQIQWGLESTAGVNVAASKRVECFDVVMGIDGDIGFYRPVGHKYETEQEQNTEWMAHTWTGNPDYNGLIYPFASAFAKVSAVAHGASGTAKDWIMTPPITGNATPATFTIEQGDSTYAHKANYFIFNEVGYTFSRKSTTFSAKSFSLPIQRAITLTGSPTVVALAPIPGKHFNLYIDSTSASLGTTQYANALQIQYLMTNIYGTFFPINRANVGFTSHVDLVPQTTLKLRLMADAQGMSLLDNLQAGSTIYVRVNAQGSVIDNQQTVTLGTQSSGTFTLTYKAQTTAAIAYNATSAAVQTAFRLLSSVPATTVVTGPVGGPYLIVFSPSDTLALDTTPITGSGASLSTPANFVITQTQSYNTFQHDMAVKVGKPQPFGDDTGIFYIEWEGRIVEDPTWNAPGQAQTMTITNLIPAL